MRVESESMTDTKIKKLIQIAFQAAQDVKGESITLLDLVKVPSYTDYVLLVTANSDRQAKAIADRIVGDVFKKGKSHPLGIEGFESGEWILIDFGDIVCHVFNEQLRKTYRLEDMWPQVRPMDEKSAEEFFSIKKKAVSKKSPSKKSAVKKVAVSKVRVRRAAKK